MSQATDETSPQEGLKDQASAKVQDAASVAQEKASELRERGSARLRNQFDQRSGRAGTQMRSLAAALRRSGKDLSNEGNSNAAQLTDQAADRLERLGGYLEQKSGEELMRDIETFARRRPWMLAGLGMLGGVAAARFMKASSEQRYENYRQMAQQWPVRSGGFDDQPEIRRSEVPGALGDDPLARDPYAATR